MENIDRIYFINLDRRPDREKHFLQQCEKENIPMNKLIRMTAIDGLTYNFNENERNLFVNADFIKGNCDNKNLLMGNQLSHYYILKDIINNNYKNTLIFQDDAILIPNFVKHIDNIVNNMPFNAEIINFGFHRYAYKDIFIPFEFTLDEFKDDTENIGTIIINNYVTKIFPNCNPCSLAYLVTLDGAKKLIEYFNNTGFLEATDLNYNRYLHNKNIFYGSRRVLATGNPELKSDIFV